jgi:hypothetical protein
MQFMLRFLVVMSWNKLLNKIQIYSQLMSMLSYQHVTSGLQKIVNQYAPCPRLPAAPKEAHQNPQEEIDLKENGHTSPVKK